MKRILLITAILTLASGCQSFSQMFKVEDSKAQAQKRWCHTRAELLCGAASEYLKSGQLDKAAGKAQEALSLENDLAPARLLLGKVYIEQGEFPAAIAEIQKARDLQPTFWEPLYYLAVAQERSGHLEDALENYRKAQAMSPGNLEPVKAAAEMMIQLNRAAEARLYLENYLGSAGNDVGMYELAGRLAMTARDYEKAVRYYQRAHDIDAANTRYREALGEAQLLNGSYVDAADTLGDLLADKKYTPSSMTYCRLGECHLVMNKPALAQDDYFKASELDPECVGVWVGLAKASLMAGDPRRGILAARKALELQENNSDALALLGYSLLKNRQQEEALAVLLRGAKAKPQDGTLRCLLGRAYAMSGNSSKAVECYQQALQLEPGNSLACELLAQSTATKTKATP
jgi:tetratricopeptide (TPR) repeat protein